MVGYYESLKNDYRNDYLTESPTKNGCKSSARIDILGLFGKSYIVKILADSNNRALTIETENEVYLQSYDTLILKVDKVNRKIYKLWDGYSNTTKKHINTFMVDYTGAVNTFSKKEWLEFEEMNY